ncbi:allantoinase AllB [Lachnospiraceae bacterium 62-35]
MDHIYDLLLKDSLVVTPAGPEKINIAVKDGQIAALLDPEIPVKAAEELRLNGRIVLPGAIDTHAHLSLHEDFDYGTKSAARGGVTTVLEMPLSRLMPNIVNGQLFEQCKEFIENTAHVDIALWGALMPENLDQMDVLYQKGCVAYKAFLSDPGDGYSGMDDYSMLQAMEKNAQLGSRIGIHCENRMLLNGLKQNYQKKTPQWSDIRKSHPIIAEKEASIRAALLADSVHCPIHICHVTNDETIDLLTERRNNGTDLTIETCPHYLLLNEDDLEKYEGYANVFPPLRNKASVEKMWDRVLSGKIDVIGSDHSAISSTEKDKDIWEVPGGFPGIDLLLILLYSEGVRKRGMSLNRLADLTSSNAAKIFGLSPRKGLIQIGSDADFAVINPDIEWEFHSADAFYRQKSEKYPYEGKKITGQVEMTLVRGQIIYRDSEIRVEKYGTFIPAVHRQPSCTTASVSL